MKFKLTQFVVCFILLFSNSATYADETQQAASEAKASTIPTYTLDYMLNNFKASKANTVELALFKPISFTANIVELPYSRKHGYLAREIKRFSPNSNIVATQGITIASDSKQPLSVYIIDELAAGIEADIAIGDSLNFQAYHVYNSINGPGLLVYQWETPVKENVIKRNLSKALATMKQWFSIDEHHHKDDLENTTKSATQGHSH